MGLAELGGLVGGTPGAMGGVKLVGSSGHLVLAAVLGTSGVIKLLDLPAVAGQLAGYRIVPRAVVGHAAGVLAVAEAGCAVLLLLPWTRLAGLLVAGGLIIGFLAAMSLALARGTRIPCGCFGGRGELDIVGTTSLVRAALLGVVVVLSLPARPAGPGPVQLLVAALVLVLVFVLAEAARLVRERRPAGARG